MNFSIKKYILIISLFSGVFLLNAQEKPPEGQEPYNGPVNPGVPGIPEAPGTPPGSPMHPGPDNIPPSIPMPPKDSDNIMKYRGSRAYTENIPLKISQIKCVRKNDVFVSLRIIFNQSINPRSVIPGTILIDNMQLPREARLAFNKRGNSIRILLPMSSSFYKLKILKIKSFVGSELEPVELLVEVQKSL